MPGQQTEITQEQMEAAAKARGYRSYRHMIYTMQNRLPQPKVEGGSPQASSGNFFGRLFDDPGKAMSDFLAWHPSNTIGRASDELAAANRRNRR